MQIIAMIDYKEKNATLRMSGARECFQIPILNDDISEGVETFKVSLDTPSPGIDFINKTLTVVIIDDGKQQQSHSQKLDYFVKVGSSRSGGKGVQLFVPMCSPGIRCILP